MLSFGRVGVWVLSVVLIFVVLRPAREALVETHVIAHTTAQFAAPPPPPPPIFQLAVSRPNKRSACPLPYDVDSFLPVAAGAERCSTGGQRSARFSSGTVVVRSKLPPGRLFAAFPGGGEVFAIGLPGRMPLRRLALELELNGTAGGHHARVANGGGASWLTLTHQPSGHALYMVPPHAAAGAWMLQLGPRNEVRRPQAASAGISFRDRRPGGALLACTPCMRTLHSR